MARTGRRRPELPLPPGKVPLRRNGSWRKRWRYLGVFSDELLLCAARVGVGPIGQTFWAVWDRESGEMHERTRTAGAGRPRRGLDRARRRRGHRDASTGRPTRAARWCGSRRRAQEGEEQVRAFLRVGEGSLGRERLPDRRGRRLRLDAQAGRAGRLRRAHRRAADPLSRRAGSRTSRAAITPTTPSGTGRPASASTTDGREVGWNLVSGINDPPQRSERAIWVDGVASEPGPVELRGPRRDRARRRPARVQRRVRAQQGGEAAVRRATATASRSAPSPARCPGGLELAEAFGVMEHHDAHW